MTRWAPQDAAKATPSRVKVQPIKRAEECGGIESLRLSEIFELSRIFLAQDRKDSHAEPAGIGRAPAVFKGTPSYQIGRAG